MLFLWQTGGLVPSHWDAPFGGLGPAVVLLCLLVLSGRWPRSFLWFQFGLHLVGLGLLWHEMAINWSYMHVLFIRTGFEAWFYVNAALANTYHAWVFCGFTWLARVNAHARSFDPILDWAAQAPTSIPQRGPAWMGREAVGQGTFFGPVQASVSGCTDPNLGSGCAVGVVPCR
jgi:hypothetical protein